MLKCSFVVRFSYLDIIRVYIINIIVSNVIFLFNLNHSHPLRNSGVGVDYLFIGILRGAVPKYRNASCFCPSTKGGPASILGLYIPTFLTRAGNLE